MNATPLKIVAAAKPERPKFTMLGRRQVRVGKQHVEGWEATFLPAYFHPELGPVMRLRRVISDRRNETIRPQEMLLPMEDVAWLHGVTGRTLVMARSLEAAG